MKFKVVPNAKLASASALNLPIGGHPASEAA